jgi:hypothetical protein
MQVQWPSGIGAVLAFIGLVIVIVLMVVGQMPFMPTGLLFLLAFLARLL